MNKYPVGSYIVFDGVSEEWDTSYRWFRRCETKDVLTLQLLKGISKISAEMWAKDVRDKDRKSV